MSRKYLRGQCPRCLPDGGAIFEWWGSAEKRCLNCGQVLPVRRVKAAPTVTPSQRRILDQVQGLGWIVEEQRFIGRKLWIVFKHETRNYFVGHYAYGTIGPMGAVALKLQRFGKEAVLKDAWDIRTWLA